MLKKYQLLLDINQMIINENYKKINLILLKLKILENGHAKGHSFKNME